MFRKLKSIMKFRDFGFWKVEI